MPRPEHRDTGLRAASPALARAARAWHFYGAAAAAVRPVFAAAERRSATLCLLLAAAALPPLAGCGGSGPGPATTGAAAAAMAGAPSDRGSLCARIDAALARVRDGRRLDAGVQGAWQVVHGILAFGRELPLRHDGGESAALDYLLAGGRLTGWKLRPGGVGVVATIDEGSTTGQGHPDQWLGYLAQCGRGGLPPDTPIVAGGRTFRLADLLAQAQADIRPGQEATWTLMALAAFVPPDSAWTAGDGARWTVERVVRMEAEADVFSAACGGAHRLFGLAAALARHRAARSAAGAAADDPASGWAAATEVLEECIDRARRFQQADGSFSIHFFERPGSSPDTFATLGATGHVFEVLTVALDDRRLAEPWVGRAAERLVTLLEQTADVDVECGGLYHAAHGLLLYRERICGAGGTAGGTAVSPAP